ncbi:MAG: OmpA family protein [Saprospiraceae bacterium]|nr:OmpA family protein [Saprospiraceae bacterium]
MRLILEIHIIIVLGFMAVHGSWSQSIPAADIAFNTIHLENPSFEDIARPSIPPRKWLNCGFPEESAPDVQPSGDWSVFKPAFHGHTYLGMVARENDTWESVGQMLEKPLRKGMCYTFSIYLCSSKEYLSQVIPDSLKHIELTIEQRARLPLKSFTKGIMLRIWGGDVPCHKRELLAQSGTIDNQEWKQFSWKIEPQSDIKYLSLEAFYKTPTLFPYNGNILVDNASGFTLTACEEDEELILPPVVKFLQPIEKINPRLNQYRVRAQIHNVHSKEKITFYVNGKEMGAFDFDYDTHIFSTTLYLKEGKNELLIEVENDEGYAKDQTSVLIIEKGSQKKEEPEVAQAASTEEPASQPPGYKILPSLGYKNIKKGQIIRVDRLYFATDSSALGSDTSSFAVLNEIYAFLKDNPKVLIEVGGHTNGGTKKRPINMRFSNELSRARARTVAEYLVDKGIPARQIQYKGYGPRKPLASNDTAQGRIKNQRVEIKILSTDG